MKANPKGYADAILIIIMITMKVNRRQFLSRTHNNGYNDADKNKGGFLPDSFLLPPILNNRENSKRIDHNFKKRLGGAYTTWSS